MKTWKKAATLFLLLLLLFLLGARAVNAEEYNAVKVVIKDANTGNVCYSHVFPNGQDFSFSTASHSLRFQENLCPHTPCHIPVAGYHTGPLGDKEGYTLKEASRRFNA